MSHKYRVTLEELTESGEPGVAPLRFDVENHDDILKIVERMKTRQDIPAADAPAFAVGLKLFSEVMIKNRKLPLFADFSEHFMEFMKTLKKG